MKTQKAELEPMQIIGKEELFFLRQGNLNVLTFFYAHILLPIKTFHGFFTLRPRNGLSFSLLKMSEIEHV